MSVPHPIKPCAKKHRIGLAIVQSGLNWSEDYPEISLIFLASPSIYDNEGMDRLTSKIVDLLEEPDLQQQIRACQTFEEFKQIFLSIK